MKKNLIFEYSEQLAVNVVNLCNENNFDSNLAYQIKKSSSSVFANVSEAQYPQSLADMLSKFEIARKECTETESWLRLLFATKKMDEATFNVLITNLLKIGISETDFIKYLCDDIYNYEKPEKFVQSLKKLLS